MPTISAMGLPWYSRNEYHETVGIMVDGERLPKDFDAWLIRAEAIERQIVASGVPAVRVVLSPNQFVSWCAAHGFACNSSARGRFAAEAARDAIRRPTR
jgi:hypothetical protein